MDLITWLLVGAIVGVIATTEFGRLSIGRLILSVAIGVIGSLTGGVTGYILYGQIVEGANITVFSIAFMIAILAILLRRRVNRFITHYKVNKSENAATSQLFTHLQLPPRSVALNS